MTDAEKIERLEGAVRSLAVLVSAHRPVPFHHHPALRDICAERWPDVVGASSLPRHAPPEEVPA